MPVREIMVYPTKASALNIPARDRRKLTVEGVMWPDDSFTKRRLADKSLTTNPAKAFNPEPAVTEPAPIEAAPAAPAASAPAAAPAPAPEAAAPAAAISAKA